MKNRLLVLVVALLVGTMILTGCGQNQNKYIGTWKAEGGMFSITMVLNKDGTGTSSSSSGSTQLTWKTEGDHILIIEPQSNQSVPARLSGDGSGLTMGEGSDSQVYIRQGS